MDDERPWERAHLAKHPAGRPAVTGANPLHELYLDALSGRHVTPSDLCLACTLLLPVGDASILSVLAGDANEVAGVSDGSAAQLVERQLSAGEGPTLEALHRGGPVLVLDLSRGVGAARWPALAAADPDPLTGAVYALPLQRGAIRLGVLTLSRTDITPLTTALCATVVEAAETVSTVPLLDAGSAPSTGHPVEDAEWPQDNPLTAEVHQATGMMLAQLDVGVLEANLRLCAHAFAVGRPLSEVAHAVVSPQLRFSPEPTTDAAGGP